MNRQQIRREAKFRAGLILSSVLDGWRPDDLISRYGQDTADQIASEIRALADRLTEQGSGNAS